MVKKGVKVSKKVSSKNSKRNVNKKVKDLVVGVRVISGLYFLGSFLMFLLGIIFLSGYSLLADIAADVGLTDGIFTGFGVFVIVIAFLFFLIALNLWKLNNKARFAVGVISGFYFLSGLISLEVIPIMINGGIIYYLFFNDDVKRLFG